MPFSYPVCDQPPHYLRVSAQQLQQTHTETVSSTDQRNEDEQTAFPSVMDKLSYDWGFVVVRTAYKADDIADVTAWSAAINRLRTLALPREHNAEMDPATFALPVMASRSMLEGASFNAVRAAFNAWVHAYVRDRREAGTGDDGDEWPSDVRRDCCIVVDELALESLQSASEAEPFVIVVDATDPDSVPYNGGGPYTGWMRATANSLGALYDNMESQGMGEGLCPIREYSGQIPLYDGSPAGRLIDPPEGLEGKYKFPRGTPRGAQAGQAMLDEIKRATGGNYT
ncbi:hypothetical protein JX265_004742 [Neoarthrinium moseri]|uniref:Uncharacterized protein n=1 Tax=Neoarthrinium moseri TaxID=1658444 RepID=A0A9P9WPY0_9PEZI|nr:hypothetical protein JX265_004742 [Neoarthrinium moseri]